MFYPEMENVTENNLPTANTEEKNTFNASEWNVPDGHITIKELEAHERKTWRQLRLAELLQKHSFKADLIVV